MNLASKIKRCALDAGFDLAGIAPLAALQDLAFTERWVAKGYGGEMHYLRNPRRTDPRLILPSVKSIVCAGLVYNTNFPYSTGLAETPRSKLEDRNSKSGQVSSFDFREPASSHSREARAWISRYAWGRDYHELMRTRLERLRASIEKLAPGVETRAHVDTGPVVERAFARLSGIGWMGKNTCLINQEKGSWVFLGVILTSLELEPDRPAFDRCGSCTRCLEACPTGALVEPYVMDASRCIAYFNIELKGSIPAEFRPAIGSNLFGCDICQDVCPWNGGSGYPSGPLRAGRSRDLEKFETRNSNLQTQQPRRRAAMTVVPDFHPLTIDRATEAQPSSPQTVDVEPSAEGRQSTGREPWSKRREGETANRGETVRKRVSNSELRFSLFNPRLEDVISLNEEDYHRAFSHSPIKRVKYQGWLRNLCVVVGNSGDIRFASWLEKLRHHTDAVVREHAEWALARLGPEQSADKP